jgi:hypothetical protein
MKKKSSSPNSTALLKSNIAQAIKVLYLTRKVTYYPANRDYPKLKEAYGIFSSNMMELRDKNALMAVNFNGGFIYKKLDNQKYESLIDFLDFLLIIPAPRFSLSKTKNSAVINEITVPKLSAILDSLLGFKFPGYWADKQDIYECVVMAIMEIIRENTDNANVSMSISNIKNNELSNENSKCINDYKNKIILWMSMGLIL